MPVPKFPPFLWAFLCQSTTSDMWRHSVICDVICDVWTVAFVCECVMTWLCDSTHSNLLTYSNRNARECQCGAFSPKACLSSAWFFLPDSWSMICRAMLNYEDSGWRVWFLVMRNFFFASNPWSLEYCAARKFIYEAMLVLLPALLMR